MPASNTDKFIKVAPNTGWQLDASGISDASVTSFGLISATSLPTDTAVILTIDRVNSSGVATPNLMERIVGVMSGTTVTSCVRGLEGTAQAHAAGAVVEIVISKSNINKLMEGILTEHNQDGTHGAITTTAAITQTQVATPSSPAAGKNKLYFKTDNKLYKLTSAGTESEVGLSLANFNAPQGFLINGKISVTDAAGITVAIKTLAGTDPSATDPVYVRIGDTVRTISAALSVAKADGTNWMNAGAAETATKEIDYFVYLGYNATDGVTIGFSRIPYANQYSDFSATTTNEKYCAISTITNAASTDYYENIGRFAATLSAGAGYTWSVPAYTAANLIQRPIYETRVLSYLPTYTGWSSLTTVITYQVRGRMVRIFNVPISGTSNSAAAQMTLPFTVPTGTPTDFQLVYVSDNGVASTTPGRSYITGNSNTLIWGKASTSDGGFTASGTKTTYIGNFEFSL